MDSEKLDSLTSKFSKESKYALINFANAVKKSNLFSDMKQYEMWKTVEMENNLIDLSLQKEEIIDSKQSENFEKFVDLTNISLKHIEGSEIQSLTDEDIETSLKEHLQFKTSNHIPSEVIEVLLKSPPETIEKIFWNLLGTLNSEQIVMFGESLEIHLENDLIIEYFCRCLLMKMTTLFAEDLKAHFLRLCSKFDFKLIPHIVNTIDNNDKVDILSLYLTHMESTLQESLMCELMRSDFTGKYILIAKCLVNRDMAFSSLKKLMEVMANSVEHYTTDKEYGNLLFKLVTYLGKDSSRVENILRHILINHKSIWRTKLLKALPATESQDF
ncbi:hypothetical protein WA026_011732 [Henosepilachna vigintioctopunctata]|uniref:Fanconi Anaemia group E protein C-terminal domain-containing protein n=1 Tax=Henosepilachna vigintioctopunctata TaxID=420089 RepID=A0AAW1UI17_9CUCU